MPISLSKAPLLEIAGLLGDTIATVADTYLHHSPDHLSGIMEADSRQGGRSFPEDA